MYSCPSIFVFFLCRRNGNGPIYAHQSAVHTAAATQGSKDNPIMSESYFSVYWLAGSLFAVKELEQEASNLSPDLRIVSMYELNIS